MPDPLLTSGEIQQLFHIDHRVLHRYRKRGCAALGGKRLQARRRCREGLRGCSVEYLYRRSDIEKIASVPALEHGGFEDGQDYLAANETASRYGFSLPSLDRWRADRCPWLGRRIRYIRRLVREGGHLRRVFLYAEQDLDQIKECQATGRSNPREPWPSTTEAIGDGFSERLLKTCRPTL